jgi:hypothetical protein
MEAFFGESTFFSCEIEIFRLSFGTVNSCATRLKQRSDRMIPIKSPFKIIFKTD